MIITEASIKDLQGIVTLFEAYRTFYSKKPDYNGSTLFLKDRLTNKDSVIYLAWNDSDELVGFTQLYPSFSSTRLQKMWILNDLYVDKSFRGQKISLKLIDKAKELTIQTKACGLMLETEKDNLIANKLYLRSEFELEKNNFYFWSPK